MHTTETQDHPKRISSCRSDRSDLRNGGIVVAVGLWLLATSMHIGGLDYTHSWPFLLILIGAVTAVFPPACKGAWSGVMLMAWGGLAVIAVYRLWGFGWFNIWPLFLVVVGLEMVINAIVQQRRPRARGPAGSGEG
jgi:hypothetical protein